MLILNNIKRQNGIVAVNVVAVVTFIAVISVFVYLVGKKYHYFEVSPSPAVTLTPSPSTTIDPTADWKTYTNKQYGFEVKYPQNWVRLEEGEGIVAPSIPHSPGFLYVPFGSPDLRVGVNLSCFKTDAPELRNRDTGGIGHNVKLVINNKEINVTGQNPIPPAGEGEPFGFQVSYCGVLQNSQKPCIVFHGFGEPIDNITKSFMESIRFSKNLDDLVGICR